jgi:tRNA threonylcarbamoyladenosine biosynthesis protein TsaE
VKRYLADLDATHAFGELLGRAAKAGLVIAATGTLGAGKTSLAQGVARGLGVPSDHYVNSPTFAIMQVHPGRMPFYHIDLYRLGDADEVIGLGLDEVIGTDGLAYIEWPSRAPEVLPGDRITITLSLEGEGRQVEMTASGPLSEAFIVQVCDIERSD